ncbi:hypothetical protein MKEN_00560300 [Mycena kentingensis (nom. inval.)]|nr:hypothetical protein MKEN_00560300 [Mycena kentingensis (nom. inval.)]
MVSSLTTADAYIHTPSAILLQKASQSVGRPLPEPLAPSRSPRTRFVASSWSIVLHTIPRPGPYPRRCSHHLPTSSSSVASPVHPRRPPPSPFTIPDAPSTATHLNIIASFTALPRCQLRTQWASESDAPMHANSPEHVSHLVRRSLQIQGVTSPSPRYHP